MPREHAREPHPLDHHPSFRAVIAATSPVSALARSIDHDLVGPLVLACGDLVHGFGAPVGSLERHQAHRRAWSHVREIDRVVQSASRHKRVSAQVIARAQRAIDRADVLISALPGVTAS
jgi:hypothetical protein